MPPRNVIVALVAALVLAVSVVMIVKRRAPDDPEAIIRAALSRTASAAEAQDMSKVMEIVSKEFKAQGMGRDDAKRVLYMHLRTSGWKRVALLDVDVRVTPPAIAKATFAAVLAKGDSHDGTWRDLAPTDASVYRFELDFVREDDGEWRVRQAAYRPARLGEP